MRRNVWLTYNNSLELDACKRICSTVFAMKLVQLIVCNDSHSTSTMVCKIQYRNLYTVIATNSIILSIKILLTKYI